MVSSAFHSTKAVVSQVGAMRLTGLWGLTVKAQCLSACLLFQFFFFITNVVIIICLIGMA